MGSLFRKTTYSRPLKVTLLSKASSFQKAAVHCTRISRGYFALGAPDCLGCDLWAEIPLASWLYSAQGVRLGVCSWKSQRFHTRFPKQAQGGGVPRGTGRRRTCRDGEGQGDKRSGVLHPPHISHSAGEHQWGMLKPMAVALGCVFQICSPRSSFV